MSYSIVSQPARVVGLSQPVRIYTRCFFPFPISCVEKHTEPNGSNTNWTYCWFRFGISSLVAGRSSMQVVWFSLRSRYETAPCRRSIVKIRIPYKRSLFSVLDNLFFLCVYVSRVCIMLYSPRTEDREEREKCNTSKINYIDKILY